MCICVCVCVLDPLYESEALRPVELLIQTLGSPLFNHRSPLRNVFIIFCFTLLGADEYTCVVNQISHSVCHACVLLVCKCHNYMIYGAGLAVCPGHVAVLVKRRAVEATIPPVHTH